ncbi:glycosyltransferase family 4 protein [Rhodococcus opacus]|uniref:glycosyltransferase family 4 protein n=1 Tax=Rhodococcus opacus TaxID=37919 RepID=UPI002474A9E5|nr:glycosyltransferase family 4 protein [Rhodococcus opacus]MDH6287833.1 hypothetical protein [Rhodococcus opacus]
MTKIEITSWEVSLHRRDGGGLRVQAFLQALDALDADYNLNAIGGREEGTPRSTALGSTKRKYLPMPLRHRAERELPPGIASTRLALGLVPVGHRWCTRHADFAWLDYADLWSEFARRHADHVTGLAKAAATGQAWMWKHRETIDTQAAAIVTTASWSDSRKLGCDARWLPTPTYSERSVPRRPARPAGTIRAGFIANFQYPPNRHAYDYMLKNWYPLLRNHNIEIAIAGFHSDSLSTPPGVSLVGEVENAADFYADIDIALAPIVTGGGMKVKVIEALTHGVPVISTEHAADGLPPILENALIPWTPNLNPETFDLTDPRESRTIDTALKSFSIESFNNSVGELMQTVAAKNTHR